MDTGVFMTIIFVQLLLAFLFSKNLWNFSVNTLTFYFVSYAGLTGITFSILLSYFGISAVGSVFIATALIFGIMATYGFFTKKDLTSIGMFASMSLLGLILVLLANVYVGSEKIDIWTSCIGVLIFMILTAYDVQKIKNINVIGNAGTDGDKKEALYGAFMLYLDFINLFLNLLRGRSRR